MLARRIGADYKDRMTRTLALTAICLSTVFALTAPLASAQERPCAQEREKFCANVTPGRGGIMDCLKAHESELSESCKKNLTTAEERRSKAQEERMQDRTRRAEHRAEATPKK